MTTLFTALADLDNLTDAWRRVRRKKSAAGVDGVTVERFEQNVTMHLRDLRRDLLRGAYRPLPLGGAYIPKASGGWRAIGRTRVGGALVRLPRSAAFTAEVAENAEKRLFGQDGRDKSSCLSC